MSASFIMEVAFFIPVIPAALSAWKYRTMQIHQKWFAILLWSILFISFSGDMWLRLTEENNMPFFHVYILVEYLIFLRIFQLMFKESINRKTWISLATGFILIWIFNIFKGEGWWGFPDYIHALEALVILGMVFVWFSKMLREKKILNPERTFEFWMCAGLLIYFTGNFLLFLFPKFLIDAGPEIFATIWKVTSILIILLYVLYTVALLWVKKTIK